MNVKEEAAEMAEEVANELSSLISKKLEVLTEIDKRLMKLESVLQNHLSNSKIVTVENERMITEKYEELIKKNEDISTNLMTEIEDLKNEIENLKKEKNY